MNSIISVLLVCLIGLSYWLLKLRRRCELLEETISELKEVQEAREARAALEGSGQERKRLAKDWHDGMGNTLSTLRLLLENATFENEERQQEIVQLLEAAQQEFRQIVDNETIESFSNQAEILGTLRKWQNQLKLGNINFLYKMYNFSNFKNNKIHLKNQIYRIAQELLSNIIKHANASKIELELFEANGTIQLIASDNGKGIKTSGQKESLIPGIRERVVNLNGQLLIDTNEGFETVIKITVPTQLE